MAPTLATLLGGLAVAAITGIVSWVVASSRAIGRLEAKPSQPAPVDLMTPKLEAIDRRLGAIETRLDAEKEYRWPRQDQIMTDATAALKDVDRALKALLDWRARGGD